MALDPALQAHVDGDTWLALVAMDERIEALEAGGGGALPVEFKHPTRVVEFYENPDGTDTEVEVEFGRTKPPI